MKQGQRGVCGQKLLIQKISNKNLASGGELYSPEKLLYGTTIILSLLPENSGVSTIVWPGEVQAHDTPKDTYCSSKYTPKLETSQYHLG